MELYHETISKATKMAEGSKKGQQIFISIEVMNEMLSLDIFFRPDPMCRRIIREMMNHASNYKVGVPNHEYINDFLEKESIKKINNYLKNYIYGVGPIAKVTKRNTTGNATIDAVVSKLLSLIILSSFFLLYEKMIEGTGFIKELLDKKIADNDTWFNEHPNSEDFPPYTVSKQDVKAEALAEAEREYIQELRKNLIIQQQFLLKLQVYLEKIKTKSDYEIQFRENISNQIEMMTKRIIELQDNLNKKVEEHKIDITETTQERELDILVYHVALIHHQIKAQKEQNTTGLSGGNKYKKGSVSKYSKKKNNKLKRISKKIKNKKKKSKNRKNKGKRRR